VIDFTYKQMIYGNSEEITNIEITRKMKDYLFIYFIYSLFAIYKLFKYRKIEYKYNKTL
jgi:hypothetical protein